MSVFNGSVITGDVWNKLRHLGLKAKGDGSQLQHTVDELNVYFAQSGGLIILQWNRTSGWEGPLMHASDLFRG